MVVEFCLDLVKEDFIEFLAGLMGVEDTTKSLTYLLHCFVYEFA